MVGVGADDLWELATGDNARTPAHDFGFTRDHADIAARTLHVVQVALRSSRLPVTWRPVRGAPDPATIRRVLVRRLWLHCLLANEWLSMYRLAKITRLDPKVIKCDRDTIARWSDVSPEFASFVYLCEELVDGCVALTASSQRAFALTERIAADERGARAEARTKRVAAPLPPSPEVVAIMAVAQGRRSEQQRRIDLAVVKHPMRVKGKFVATATDQAAAARRISASCSS